MGWRCVGWRSSAGGVLWGWRWRPTTCASTTVRQPAWCAASATSTQRRRWGATLFQRVDTFLDELRELQGKGDEPEQVAEQVAENLAEQDAPDTRGKDSWGTTGVDPGHLARASYLRFRVVRPPTRLIAVELEAVRCGLFPDCCQQGLGGLCRASYEGRGVCALQVCHLAIGVVAGGCLPVVTLAAPSISAGSVRANTRGGRVHPA